MRCGNDATTLDGSDPRRMVFVLHGRPAISCRASWRACTRSASACDDEEALAPWAIDDATDELYAHRVRPRDALWLAADNLNALFWGLHDWAHFHNHGPFEQRAWTELQCDATALAWLWMNREAYRPRERKRGSECAERGRRAVARAVRGRGDGRSRARSDPCAGRAA